MKNKKIITTLFVVAVLIVMIIGAISVAYNVKSSKDAQDITKTQPEYIEKLLNKDSVAQVNISIDETDWKWLLENASKKEPRSCDVTINGTTFYNVGINPKGNSSLTTIVSDNTTDRYSFKLDFGEFVEGQTYFGLRKIVLNNMMSDKSYMKEALSYDLFDYMGVATPAYSYSNIKLNGEDWGLYLAVEVIEESFIEREFATSEGNLYKPESMEMGGGNAGGNDKGAIPNNANREKNGQMPNMEAQKQLPGNMNGAPEATDGNVNKGAPEATDGNVNKGVSPAAGGDVHKEAPKAENRGAGGGMNMGGMMGSGKGADLKYTGDLASNYSTIQEGAVFKRTSDKDFEKIINMIKHLDSGIDLENYLDVEGVLRYFAVNTFLVNLDSYSGGMYHNYYLYENDGVVSIIPWDLNMSFAGFSMNDATKAINFPIDAPVTGNLESAPLIGKLLEVPKYKKLYHSYLKEISEKYINSGVYEDSIINTDKLINSYVKGDVTALYTYEEYSESIPMMVAFGQDRAESIDAQLDGTQPSTTYGTITTAVNLSSLGGMEMGGGKGESNKNVAAGPKSDIRNAGVAPNMGNMPNAGAAPNMENMQAIMKIVQEANGKEFTAEQKESLKSLGVDDTMLSNLKNVGNGGGFPAMGNVAGVPTMGNAGSEFKIQVAIIASATALLFVGLLVILKFKRRKFHAR